MRKYLLPLTVILLIGISGLIVFSQDEPTIPAECKKAAESITAEELKDVHINYLALNELHGRSAGSEGGEAARQYLAKDFKTYGLKPAGDKATYLQEFPMTLRGKKTTLGNVVGYLEGSDPDLKKELIIVGAHYDHIGLDFNGEVCNGADDNGSGTAGVLEIAEAFSTLPAKPKRSILFICFDGEEMGFLGSSHYIKNPLFPLDKTIMMVNLDMIGRSKNNRLEIYGAGTSPDFNKILAGLNTYKECQLECRMVKGQAGSSDQAVFASRMPTLFFCTGLHSDLHQPTDDTEKINGITADKVATLAFLFIYTIANQPAKPSFNKPQRSRFSPGPATGGAFLGIVPDQEGSEEGCLIGEVLAGRPAEQGGIKAGDIITRLDTSEIQDFEDLARFISSKKPGDEVKITLLRKNSEGKNEKKTLTIKLGERGDDTEPPQPRPEKPEPAVYLGISVDPKANEKGYSISQVIPDSPAHKAGLQTGDIITKLNGKRYENWNEIRKILRFLQVNDKVKIVILRDGEEKEITVQLERKPDID